MLRSILSAVALAGFIAVAHPAFADPLAATPADHAQPAAAATSPRPLDAPAPAGFGWG